MPHIYQIDPAWSELPYAGGTIRENACGPTCLTMVYIFKTGHTDMTPVDMCALSEAGNYAPTGATEWSFMTGGAWQLGLNGTQLYNNRESITQALHSGAPVIAAVRPGTFTNVGHYIVLYGIDDANQIGVYDPTTPQPQRPPLGRGGGPQRNRSHVGLLLVIGDTHWGQT